MSELVTAGLVFMHIWSHLKKNMSPENMFLQRTTVARKHNMYNYVSYVERRKI